VYKAYALSPRTLIVDLTVADRIRHIPAHAPKDDIPLNMTPFERDRHHPNHRNSRAIVYRTAAT